MPKYSVTVSLEIKKFDQVCIEVDAESEQDARDKVYGKECDMDIEDAADVPYDYDIKIQCVDRVVKA